MKYKSDGNYIQVSRDVFKEERFKKLSVNARWLYCVLVYLEANYTGKEVDYFYHSNEQLAKDTGLSISSVKRAKKELKGIVDFLTIFFSDKSGKKSRKHITGFRLRE